MISKKQMLDAMVHPDNISVLFNIDKFDNIAIDGILNKIKTIDEKDFLLEKDHFTEILYQQLELTMKDLDSNILAGSRLLLFLTYLIDSKYIVVEDDKVYFEVPGDNYEEHFKFIENLNTYRNVYRNVTNKLSEIEYRINVGLANYNGYSEWSSWYMFYSKLAHDNILVPEISSLMQVLNKNREYTNLLRKEFLEVIKVGDN